MKRSLSSLAAQILDRIGTRTRGLEHALAQIGSFGTARPIAEFPKGGQDALRKDWERLGADMTRAIDKVRDREQSAQ